VHVDTQTETHNAINTITSLISTNHSIPRSHLYHQGQTMWCQMQLYLPLVAPSITFLQPPSMEPPVPPGPDNVVSAANLSCTVANEGSFEFQWQWTPPPGINISQMWVADETRTSIVQISQISAANAGDYTCRASFNGTSANNSIVVQLNRKGDYNTTMIA